MKSYDFHAVVSKGEVYCVGCVPNGVSDDDDPLYPIFADEEWDSYPVCDRCGCKHDYVSLTSYGEATQALNSTRTSGGCGTSGVRSASCNRFIHPNDPTPPRCSPPPVPEGAVRKEPGKEIKPLFDTGRVLIERRVLEIFSLATLDGFLAQHVTCVTGPCSDWHRVNEISLRDGGPMFSLFRDDADHECFILTEPDHSRTTVMMRAGNCPSPLTSSGPKGRFNLSEENGKSKK